MPESVEELSGWDNLDPREPALLSRLLLDSVVRGELNDGQAIALGVAYANLDHAEAVKAHTEALRLQAMAFNRLASVMKEQSSD